MKRHEFTGDQLTFIETMPQPFVVCQIMDGRAIPLAASDGFGKLFGRKDQLQACPDVNQALLGEVHPDDVARSAGALQVFVAGEERLDPVYRARKGDGPGYRVIHMLGEHAHTEDGAGLAHIWYTEEGDFSGENGPGMNGALNQAFDEGSIAWANHYDTLTGLPNMSYFFELAEKRIQEMQDRGGLPALLHIDLNGMKHYNHEFGFAEGDKLLKLFSALLSSIFHAENCCHTGADRFAAICDEEGLDESLNRLFREWSQINVKHHLPVSVGIYPNRIEAISVGMAYDRAKIACDTIKGVFTSTYKYYSSEMNDGLVRQQYVLDNFDRALSEKWIQVYYQPIVRAINSKVCDEEALARWIDPVKGFLSPADFIPYLEDSGLIYKLDLYVLERVLEDLKIKENEGFYPVPHSINLSRSDFDACDMVEEVRRRVDAAGVSRNRISIEITESVIGSDLNFMKTQVERFQALGFPVWMDDFGSGYSSLDVLQSIKFNLLKFNMGFMRRLDESDGRTILTELMKMASALGVDTICEGVETEAQVRFLQEIGCTKLQGFYFSRPRPIDYILEKHRENKLADYENPEESAYYESICGVNLYDVSVIARGERSSLQNTYSMLPMGIIEIKDDSTRFVRTNQSYRFFSSASLSLTCQSSGRNSSNTTRPSCATSFKPAA